MLRGWDGDGAPFAKRLRGNARTLPDSELYGLPFPRVNSTESISQVRTTLNVLDRDFSAVDRTETSRVK